MEVIPQPGVIRKGVWMRAFARTDVGKVRDHNEDGYLLADLSSASVAEEMPWHALGDRGALVIVCDGMGGAAAGEVASALALRSVYERMLQAHALPRTVDSEQFGRALVHAVEWASEQILREAELVSRYRGREPPSRRPRSWAMSSSWPKSVIRAPI